MGEAFPGRLLTCVLGVAAAILGPRECQASDAFGTESPLPPCVPHVSGEDFFPDLARHFGLEGRVVVEFGLTPAGRPTGTRILFEEPQGVYFGREALKFTATEHCQMLKEWSGPGLAALRFRLSFLFKLEPCLDPCRPLQPIQALSPLVTITAEGPHPPR